jgi:two-component system nitrate/nitrite sensor histidine kinase NarX
MALMAPLPLTTQSASLDASHAIGTAAIAKITDDVAAGGDLRELLQRFLEPIVHLAHAQAGAVRVLSAQGNQLELVGAVGLPEEVLAAEGLVDSRCGFCGVAAEEKRVIWATDLGGCCARAKGAYFGHECLRVVVVPLQHKGRILGVCNLFFALREPSGDDVSALLRSIGELLGLALDNSRLEAENLRATVMQERQMMAAEVHDSVAQNLTFIKMRVPLLRDAIVEQDRECALKYLDDIRETAGEAHASLREIVTHFRAPMYPGGLGRALEALTVRFRLRTGIELQVTNRMPGLHLTEAGETELFRIVQEALANIQRHSGARHAWLNVEPTLAGVEVSIEDDGVGQASRGAVEAGAHHGTGIMSERARRLGGALTVGPRGAGGTQVRLTLPISRTGEGAP